MKSSLALFLLALPLGLSSAGEPVEVRLPKGALQPRVATTTDGTTQIVFLEGTPQACEVKLASLSPTGALSAPVTVSAPSTPAIAMGTVRGPSIATGEPQKHPLPTWSYGACAALPDGRFAIIY